MMGHALRCTLLVFLLVFAGAAAAQPGWVTRHFNSNNGLPQNSVNDLLMDSLDYLWITTEGGLVRFDGQVFKRYDLPGGGRPRSERMEQLLSSPKGELIVTDALRNTYEVKENGAVLPKEIGRTDIWGIKGGMPSVARYMNAALDSSAFPGYRDWRIWPVWMLPLDADRWAVPSVNELLWYSDSLLVGRTALPPRSGWFMIADQKVVILDSSGHAFSAGFNADRVRPMELDGWPTINGNPGVPKGFFWHLADRAAVLCFEDRFHLLAPGRTSGTLLMEQLDVRSPVIGRPSDVLWHPRTRMLAIGTVAHGLFILQQSAFVTRRVDQHDQENGFYAQVPYGNDGVVAFNSALHPILFKPTSAEAFLPGILSPAMRFAVPLANGNTLCMSDVQFVELTPKGGLVSRTVKDLPAPVNALCMEKDTLWIGSHQGLGVVVDNVFHKLLFNLDIHQHGIHFLQRGPDGLMWFVNAGGLFKLHPGSWKATPVKGLEGSAVRVMTAIDGLLFIGTYGHGAFLWHEGEAIPFPLDHDSLATHVHAFVKDANGYIWRSTNRGLFRCASSDVVAWLKDHTRPIYHEYFGTASGIANTEFNGGCDPSSVWLGNGMLSFPSMDGLIQFRPSEIPARPSHVHIQFEEIIADGTHHQHGLPLRFACGTKRLDVHFSTSYWHEPANLQLEYQLEGDETEWHSIAPDQRLLTIPNLQAGEYALVLRSLGSREGQPTRLAFVVYPPWFRTWWAIALFVLLAIGLVALIARLYARNVLRKKNKLEKAIEERTVSLATANNELARSIALKERLIAMVSHDIVSPLRYIAQVAGSTHAHVSGGGTLDNKALADIQFASEKLHSNSRNLLNWVKQHEGVLVARPRNEVVALLVDDLLDRVRNEAVSKGIVLQNDVPLDDVLMVDKELLSIVLNNLLMNAVSYTERGHVKVSSHTAGGVYHLAISDTGPGLDQDAQARIERIREERRSIPYSAEVDIKGLGYIIIASLMELLGGGFKVSSSATEGTTVILHLPLK